MTDTRDDKEFVHFEYRAAFADGRASRDAEVATLSAQLAEAQGVIERQAKAMKDLVDLAERLSPYALSPTARQIIAAANNLAQSAAMRPAEKP